MGEYKDNFKFKSLSLFLSLTIILFNFNFIYADEHLVKIENLNSNNYSLNVYYPAEPKVGYIDLEIEFEELPGEIKLLLVASLGKDKFQTYALSTANKPKIYKCVFDLEKSGVWNFDVTIISPLEEEKLNFQIDLLDRNRETSPFSLSFYLFSLIFLAIFLGPLYIFRKNIFNNDRRK